MYIKVRVIANSRKEYFEVLKENSFKVCVKEKAERNMANKRVLELVAKHLKLKPEKIRIINGHNSPSKMLSVLEN
jgi:uncharacterized protein YggU (UPF0235/DUF167 family)